MIYSFPESGEGPSPLIVDSDGNLYGTYASGGSHGHGYVFELSPASAGSWSLTDIHDFNGRNGAESTTDDANGLLGGMIMDTAGNLYGTAGSGGSGTACDGGCGVIFRLKRESGRWVGTVLHSFNGIDGMNPDAALLMDASGNFYGTTTGGGSSGFGAVFETALVSGTWQTHDIYSFTNVNGDGGYPNSPLIADGAGNLYGATEAGGGIEECTVVTTNGCGTVFKLSEKGGGWEASILHDSTGGADGGFPGGVVLAADRNLYGVALLGGIHDAGVFFKMVP